MSQVAMVVVDADYRGNVVVLRQAAFVLAPRSVRLDNAEAAIAAQYWRSFASWPIAVNGQTAGSDAASLDAP
jgi:hypothetical protein